MGVSLLSVDQPKSQLAGPTFCPGVMPRRRTLPYSRCECGCTMKRLENLGSNLFKCDLSRADLQIKRNAQPDVTAIFGARSSICCQRPDACRHNNQAYVCT
jgi:hypothetical protein